MKVFKMLVAVAVVAMFANVGKAQCVNGQCQVSGRVTQILDNTAGRAIHGVGVVIDGVSGRVAASGQALLAPRQICPSSGCQVAPATATMPTPVQSTPVAASSVCCDQPAPKGLIRQVLTAPVRVVREFRENRRCR